MTKSVENQTIVQKLQAVMNRLGSKTSNPNFKRAIERLQNLHEDLTQDPTLCEHEAHTIALRILKQHRKIAIHREQPIEANHLRQAAFMILAIDPTKQSHWSKIWNYGLLVNDDTIISTVKKQQGYKLANYSHKIALAKQTEKKLVTQLAKNLGNDEATQQIGKLMYDLERNKILLASLPKNKIKPRISSDRDIRHIISTDTNSIHDNQIKTIIKSHQNTSLDQDCIACDKLERSLKLFYQRPLLSYFAFYSVPLLGPLSARALGLDINILSLVSNIYALSGYSDSTREAFADIHHYIFERNKEKPSREKLNCFFDWLVFNKNSFFKELNNEDNIAALQRSSKNAEHLRREFKITCNRLLRDYGYYTHINGTKRSYFDAEGEAHPITDYDTEIKQHQHRSYQKHQSNQRKAWLWGIAWISGFLVALGQGALPAAGFYFNFSAVGQALTSVNVPVLNWFLPVLKLFFTALSTNPVLLIATIGLLFVSGFICNFYLFKNDSYGTLKAFFKTQDNISWGKRLLKTGAMFVAFCTGATLALIVLYSLLQLAPLIAPAGLSLTLLNGLAWMIAGATLLNMPLVMYKALEGKIDSALHRSIGRYIVNLVLPYICWIRFDIWPGVKAIFSFENPFQTTGFWTTLKHIFSITNRAENTTIEKLDLPEYVLVAAEWDKDSKEPRKKWDSLQTHEKNIILRLALHKLMEQDKWKQSTRAAAIKQSFKHYLPEKLGLKDFSELLTNEGLITDHCSWDDIEERLHSYLLCQNIPSQNTNEQQQLKERVTAYLTHQPLLTKTQHQQYAWALKTPFMKIASLLWQTARIIIVGVVGTAAVSLLAVCSMTLGWGKVEHLALTDIFHIGSQFADVFTFVVAYACTGLVISLFFGAGIVQFLDQLTKGQTCSGFGNSDTAHDPNKPDKKQRLRPKRGIGFYVLHATAILFTLPLIAALVLNAFGNACLSLLNQTGLANSSAWHLWSNIVGVEAGFASLITSFMGSLVGSWFSVREAQANTSPLMTLPLNEQMQQWHIQQNRQDTIQHNAAFSKASDQFDQSVSSATLLGKTFSIRINNSTPKQTLANQFHGSGYYNLFHPEALEQQTQEKTMGSSEEMDAVFEVSTYLNQG